MGQENILEFLMNHSNRWFTVRELIDNLKEENKEEGIIKKQQNLVSLERSIRRCLLILIATNQIESKAYGWIRKYMFLKESQYKDLK
jgi:translation initiation factor 2B subunit (eIF-2B alpha/beta/delta family)